MTTLLWHKGRVYADSQMWKGGESFQTLTKVVPVKPFAVKSEKQGVKSDLIYGWFCTGTMICGQALVDMAAKFEDLDMIETMYEFAVKNRLACKDNGFEILFFGADWLYQFKFDETEAVLKKIDKDRSVAMGSGCEITIDALRDDKADPVRAMLKSYYVDPFNLVNGVMDVWELRKLPAKRGFKFERIGIYNARPKAELPKLLTDLTKPLPFDLVLNKGAKK